MTVWEFIIWWLGINGILSVIVHDFANRYGAEKLDHPMWQTIAVGMFIFTPMFIYELIKRRLK